MSGTFQVSSWSRCDRCYGDGKDVVSGDMCHECEGTGRELTPLGRELARFLSDTYGLTPKRGRIDGDAQ